MSKPMPSATPTTMPTTVPLLMPFELTDPCPRVGSAVADGAGMIIVLAWPVTVVTLVMASVAVLGDGAEVGEGPELGTGDVTSVVDCACATNRVSTIQSQKNRKETSVLEPCFRREDAVNEMRFIQW
jgi:hypothetical protein